MIILTYVSRLSLLFMILLLNVYIELSERLHLR